jgi:gentisate 1,2-dioxygenase
MDPNYEDRLGWTPPEHKHMAPHVWRKAEIEGQIENLLDAEQVEGRRSVRISHPETGPEGGAAPGIGVVVSVLRPGEADRPHRHTFSVINFIRDGHGHSVIGGQRFDWGPGDVFTTPGWAEHYHEADADSPPVVRFSFTDAPLLTKLQMCIYEDAEAIIPTPQLSGSNMDGGPTVYEGIKIDDSGAQLLTYKQMLAPKIVSNVPMIWKWDKVNAELSVMDNDSPEYAGRRVVLLYHPATGSSQGTTATLTALPGLIVPGEVHRIHRHSSAAITYMRAGRGHSEIAGERYEWEAGDMIIAPAWATHGHANDGDETVLGITIHDVPLLYNVGALLWQEVLTEHLEVLGQTGGIAATTAGAES